MHFWFSEKDIPLNQKERAAEAARQFEVDSSGNIAEAPRRVEIIAGYGIAVDLVSGAKVKFTAHSWVNNDTDYLGSRAKDSLYLGEYSHAVILQTESGVVPTYEIGEIGLQYTDFGLCNGELTIAQADIMDAICNIHALRTPKIRGYRSRLAPAPTATNSSDLG